MNCRPDCASFHGPDCPRGAMCTPTRPVTARGQCDLADRGTGRQAVTPGRGCRRRGRLRSRRFGAADRTRSTCLHPRRWTAALAAARCRPGGPDLLSGDGSLSVAGITWRGWGTDTARRGTADANTCQPSCAQGTYRHHPASRHPVRPRTLAPTGSWPTPARQERSQVSFSNGGTGAMAVISAGGSKMSLYLGRILRCPRSAAPRPTPNVLPGVSLVLTATPSAAAGGFREVLVIQDAAAPGRIEAGGSRSRGSAAAPGPRRRLPPRSTAAGQSSLPAAGRVGAPRRSSQARPRPARRPRPRKAVGAGLAAARRGPPVLGGRARRRAASAPHRGRRQRRQGDSVVRTPACRPRPPQIPSTSTRTSPCRATRAAIPGPSPSPGARAALRLAATRSGGLRQLQDGGCQTNDTDYALYQIAIPSRAPGQARGPACSRARPTCCPRPSSSPRCTRPAARPARRYTCRDGGLSKSTGWLGPGPESGGTDATAAMARTQAAATPSKTPARRSSQGFNELPNLNKLSNSSGDITLRVWENGDTNDADHKQLTDNPDIQVDLHRHARRPARPGGHREHLRV